MERILNNTQLPENTTIVATIGMFDGVHLGHQKLLGYLNECAQSQSAKSLVFSFDMHPRIVLDRNAQIELLSTAKEKTDRIAQSGVDFYVPLQFTKEFSDLTAFEFVRDILVNQYHIQHLIVGHDHQFGKNREGNFEQLQEYAEMFDFTVEQFSAVDFDGKTISSTKIRNALQLGNIGEANAMLGYDYEFSGEVIKGKEKGRRLGYPTANIKIEPYKLVPKQGVYVAEVIWKNEVFQAMLNIGTQPTLKGENIQIEAHILDFSQDLYGETLKVIFKKYLRDEQLFSTEQDLMTQLQKDETETRNYFLRG